MMLVAVILGVVAGGLAAWLMRARLNRLAFLTWTGWLLVGTGLPVLAGQLLFLALAGEATGQQGEMAVYGLVAGFGGGLGWAAVTTGLRLTRQAS